jgi:hypothetical protein
MARRDRRLRTAPVLVLAACLLAIPPAAGCRPREPESGFANRH